MKNEIKELMRQNGVVIYGAGRLGQQVYQELVKYNFPKPLVWDRNAEVKKNSSVPMNIAKKLNYVDTTSMDSIYIGEKTNVEILRRQIKELIKKDYLEICRYCDGNKNIVIAGEQAEHIKDEGTDEVEL